MISFATARATRSTVLRSLLALPAAALFLATSALIAHAASVSFNFNSSSLYSNWSTTASPPTTDNSAAITTYMNGLLPTGESVTVTGAQSVGSNTNAGYAGEGHVVCKSGGTYPGCTPETLATKYSAPFLVTDGNVTVGGDNAIQMAFTGTMQVSSLTFAFEIFPDVSCPNSSSCNPVPDFTFMMTSGASTLENCTVSAAFPGSSTTTTAPACTTGAISSFLGGASDSTNQNSPLTSSELTGQYIGTMTFNLSSPVSNPTLSFIDWPATIGVGNMSVGLTPKPVPEPSSLALLLSGLMIVEIVRRRRREA